MRCFQILLCLKVLTNNTDYQCTTDVWKRKRQVTEARSPASRMLGAAQLLLHQVKETSGVYQHGPAPLDIYSKHTSIFMPNDDEIDSKGPHLSPNSTLKNLKQSYHGVQYFWQSQAPSRIRAENNWRM